MEDKKGIDRRKTFQIDRDNSETTITVRDDTGVRERNDRAK